MGSEVIVIPIIFGVLFGIFYLFISSRHKERLALIEKGADVRCGVIHPSFNKSFMKDRFVPSQLNYCKSENLSSLDLSK